MVKTKSTSFDAKNPLESSDMSESLIRVQRLKGHQKLRGWSDSELARQLSKSPSQVHAWFTGQRNIGERLARQIEEALKLPRLYLDERDVPTQRGQIIAEPTPAPWVGGSVAMQPSATKPVRAIPVLGWKMLGAMLAALNTDFEPDFERLDTFSNPSEQAKFIEMNDDSMEPDISRGDHLLLDPAVQPRAGDLVLVRLPSGEHLVRKYVPRTANAFRAETNNPNYADLTSQDDQVVVVATMVEHRRYRKP